MKKAMLYQKNYLPRFYFEKTIKKIKTTLAVSLFFQIQNIIKKKNP